MRVCVAGRTGGLTLVLLPLFFLVFLPFPMAVPEFFSVAENFQ